MSQPTLSRQIQAIEEQFQTPLFVRGGRGMMLTEAGKQLHEGLQSIERQLRSLKTDVAAVSLEPSGEVAFGIPPSPRGLIAVPLVKSFNAGLSARSSIRIVEETSAQLRDLVANGLIDVAVTNTHEPGHGVAAQQLGRERMLLVGPASAKLSMRRETPIEALADLPLILTMRPNSLRLTIETGLGVHGLQPNVRFEANTLPLMTDLVDRRARLHGACRRAALRFAGAEQDCRKPDRGSLHHLAGRAAEGALARCGGGAILRYAVRTRTEAGSRRCLGSGRMTRRERPKERTT